jgi:hypothetical protein
MYVDIPRHRPLQLPAEADAQEAAQAMPIRIENRGRYPADWKTIRRAILGRAGNVCEMPGCGAVNYQPHPITGSKVVLTTTRPKL